MFTGLIEEQGTLKHISKTPKGMELTISCSKILQGTEKGSSICVNGACQTVIKYDNNSITVQASNETVNVTNFKYLKEGVSLNLERALTLNKRIDGHIVSGHVDCIAQLLDTKDDGFSKKFFFQLPDEFSKYVIYKGSIAVNGVSLTVASIKNNIFSVELIPLTIKEVNISHLTKGDFVNIEIDILAKYIEKFLNSKDNKSNISYSFLAENGFV